MNKPSEVTIQLSTFDRTRSAEVTLERSFSVSELIEESKKNWALPSDTQYHVLNETRGTQLSPKQLLSTDAVNTGDHLIIQPMLVAGANFQRLQQDHERVQALTTRKLGKLEILQTTGTPPSVYRLRFQLRSIEKLDAHGNPVYRNSHVVKVSLPDRYPLPGSPPAVELEAPLFHPHVFTNNKVCIGSRHVVGEFLDKFVERMAAIITFKPDYFDFNSPANRVAMEWTRKQLNSGLFPTDSFADAPPRSGISKWKNL